MYLLFGCNDTVPIPYVACAVPSAIWFNKSRVTTHDVSPTDCCQKQRMPFADDDDDDDDDGDNNDDEIKYEYSHLVRTRRAVPRNIFVERIITRPW